MNMRGEPRQPSCFESPRLQASRRSFSFERPVRSSTVPRFSMRIKRFKEPQRTAARPDDSIVGESKNPAHLRHATQS